MSGYVDEHDKLTSPFTTFLPFLLSFFLHDEEKEYTYLKFVVEGKDSDEEVDDGKRNARKRRITNTITFPYLYIVRWWRLVAAADTPTL